MTESSSDIFVLIADMAHNARAAAHSLSCLNTAAKNKVLLDLAAALSAQSDAILVANSQDIAAAQKKGLSAAMIDRLRLDIGRLESIAQAVRQIAELPDPVGDIMDNVERPNGLKLSRVRVPIGVLGIIYESRPNVTIDAAALAFKSGNAVILRGGSEAQNSNRIFAKIFADVLQDNGLPVTAIQLVPTQDRAAVGAMLAAMGQIDLIIPRGGKSLVARVQADARVPVLAHLDGVCHSYVHASAEPAKAEAIIVNAKMRRTGICGATETVLIDADYPAPDALIHALIDAGCEVRGDDMVMELDRRTIAADNSDWGTEYLAPVISARMVSGVEEAVQHISKWGSGHTEAIIAEDDAVIDRFITHVDSAIVMANASTQFADGGEFGLGAEIGIATGRLHARGPVALEGLTSYKWVVRGTGQVRD